LHPVEERSDRIKKEMERQKEIDPDGRSDTGLGRNEEMKSDSITPTPSPEETVRAGE